MLDALLPSAPAMHRTAVVLTAAWVLFVALGSLTLWRVLRRYERTKPAFLIALGVVIAPLVATASLFPATYTLTSIFGDQALDFRYWQEEFVSGRLALRITSLMLTYQLARAAFRFVLRRRELIATRERRGLSDDDVADYTTFITCEELRLWQRSDLASLAFFQFSFYLVALTGLWLCAVTGLRTPLTALTSWALLFIVDDWAVIADYCHEFGSMPILSHARKVICVDVGLFVLVPMALYPAQSAVASAVLLLMASLGILLAMFFWRARYFGKIETESPDSPGKDPSP